MNLGPLVFGTNVFGWTVDEAVAFDLLDRCVEHGIRHFDTADHYVTWAPGGRGGESETILGKWLSDRKPPDVGVITKVGFPMGDGGRGLGRRHIRESISRSLDRLQRDHVEMYLAHLEDPNTPIEETMEAFAELIEEGLVREIGVSQVSSARIDRACSYASRQRLPSFAVYETLYNLYEREPFECDGAEVARRHAMRVLPYRALAAGFLTGKYRTREDSAGRARGARVREFFDERGARVLSALDQVVAETGRTHAAIALAWLLAKTSISSVLVSATTVEQIDQQASATDVVLTGDQIVLLDEAGRVTPAGGEVLR